MKTKYILLALAGIALCLPACKKDNKIPVISNVTLLGRWNEVKLHLTENNNGTVTDTTINAASFNSTDYAQFNRDYTVNIYIGAGNVITGGSPTPNYVYENTYNYTISGSTAILISQAILFNINIPAGSISLTATFVDANTIDLHYIDSGGANKVVSDTYYARAQ